MRSVWPAFALIAFGASCHRLEPSLPIPESQRPVLGLTGPAWKLVEMAGSPALEASEATLDFLDTGKSDSRVTGNASCNQFSGKAQISGSSLHFSPLISTRISCAAEVNDQESKYLKALQSAERFELKGNGLAIYSKGVEKPLRFVQRR